VLLSIVVGTVWFLPRVGTLTLALVAAVLSVIEYAAIAEALGARISRVVAGLAAVGLCFGTAIDFGSTSRIATFAPLAAGVATSAAGARALAAGVPGHDALPDAAVTLFPAIYIGLPLGMLAAIAADTVAGGRAAVLLLMAVIVVSDSAQYYTGR